MIFVPLPPLVGRPRGPLFCPGEGGIDEGLLQLQFPSGLQLLRQSTQDAFQLALPHLLLEMTMASLGKADTSWAVRATVPPPQGSQNTVGDCSCVLPRTTSTIGASLRPQDRFAQLPLGITEFPSSSDTLFLRFFLHAENC